MKKLALKQFPPHIIETLLLDAKSGLLNFNTLSQAYIMRKLKCTESMAKQIIRELEIAT